jgi:N-formylglutamate deformylase
VGGGRPPFEVVAGCRPAVPVVVHVPHSGTHIPADVRAELLLSDQELSEELRRMTDHRTDVLVTEVAELGATRFVNRWSRLVVDPERFTDPALEEMEAVGMGAVYTATSDGRPLRTPDAVARQELLDRHFGPYHAAFTELVDGLLDASGRCVIVDVHSYPSRALAYELHGDGPRPPLCVGTDPRHTPRWLSDLVLEVAGAHGLAGELDSPFAGTFVPTRHLGDERVRSVMLEIRRDTYLDEATAEPHAGEATLRRFCRDVVGALVDDLRAR